MFHVDCDNVLDKYNENVWTNSRKELEFTNQEDFPPEKGFRGFEIAPRVLCERLDVTAYLNKQKMKKLSSKKENSLLNPDSKLLQLCSVILVRQDLEHLKKTYNNNINKHSKYLKHTNTPVRKCKVCEKVYMSEKRLKNHVETKHTIVYNKSQKRVSFSDEVTVHELKEYHYCRKCPRVYEDYQTLKRHMKLVHKKRKCYICFYCNKEFVDRMFFKVHIKMHCNMCGKFFMNRNLYNDHRRTVCGILKKYNCKTCNETYFSFLSLKDHSYEHEGVIFVCDICKERCISKCLLLHHIQYLHCKKHPKTLYDTKHIGTNVTYECNSCDHCSNNKEVIENHTTSLPDLKDSLTTGYNDYYFCDQCYEQFDTETKMLRHKWTHFMDDKKNKSCKNNIFKTTYKSNEQLPIFLQPKLVLEKLNFDNLKTNNRVKNNIATSDVPSSNTHSVIGNIPTCETPTSLSNTSVNCSTITECDGVDNRKNIEVVSSKPLVNPHDIEHKKNLDVVPSKPVVHPHTKKTIISKHQCLKCGNYYSSAYCLRRHINSVHDKKNLKCSACGVVFPWPALLKSHNCMRKKSPQISLEDARPGIQFNDPYNHIQNDGNVPSDDMNTSYDIDYEIPSPIVELTEYDNLDLIVSNEGSVSLKANIVQNIDNIKYIITMQEVPIEF